MAERQVRTFRQSRLGREVEKGTTFKEYSFALSRGSSILRGQIDLIIRDREGRLIVVDYKTSRIDAAQVEERATDYELQLRIYALAIQEVFRQLPERAYLYFLHPDVERSVDLSTGALAAAEEAIIRFFGNHQTHSFPQNVATHCFSCGYRDLYCPEVGSGMDSATG